MKTNVKGSNLNAEIKKAETLVTKLNEVVLDAPKELKTPDFKSMTPKEIQDYYKALKFAKSEVVKVKSDSALEPLKFAMVYKNVQNIYNRSIKGEYVFVSELMSLLPEYDVQGLVRDVNTEDKRILSNMKLNRIDGGTRPEDLYVFDDINKGIKKALNLTKAKMTPREILRKEALKSVISEHGFDEVIIEFNSNKLETPMVKKSLNGDVHFYKWDNSIKILFGFELLKTFLISMGADEDDFLTA